MPIYTVETTYRLPVYRRRDYEAATPEEACSLALDDEGWGDAEEDVDTSGETYVIGIWKGRDAAHSGERSRCRRNLAKPFSARPICSTPWSRSCGSQRGRWVCRSTSSSTGFRARFPFWRRPMRLQAPRCQSVRDVL